VGPQTAWKQPGEINPGRAGASLRDVQIAARHADPRIRGSADDDA
jgi:hypothetical protein